MGLPKGRQKASTMENDSLQASKEELFGIQEQV